MPARGCQGGGQQGPRWRSWGWGTWGRCPRGGREGAGCPPGTHMEVSRDQAGVTLKFRFPALPEHHSPTLLPPASLPGEGWGLGMGLALGCLLPPWAAHPTHAMPLSWCHAASGMGDTSPLQLCSSRMCQAGSHSQGN